MTVIDPVKVVLTNYPEDKMEYVTIENNPEQETMEHGRFLLAELFILNGKILWKRR